MSKIRWNKSLAVTIPWLWLWHAGPAAAEPVDLATLEALALRHEARAHEAEAVTDQAEAEVNLARSGYQPTVSLSAEGLIAPGNALVEVLDSSGQSILVRGSRPLGDSRAFRVYPSYRASVGVGAPIYDFGRTSSAVRAAEARVAVAHANNALREQEVRLRVQALFLRWYEADSLERIARTAAEESARHLGRVEALIREQAHPASESTVAAYEAEAARLRAMRALAELRAARADIEAMTGVTLTEEAIPDPHSLELEEVDARDDTPAERAVDAARRAAVATAEMHEDGHMPQLSAGLRLGVYGQSEHAFPSYEVLLRFELPLWDGGRDRARSAVARARASELDARAQALAGESQDRRKAATEQRRLARQMLALAEEALRLARVGEEQAEERYEIKGGDLTELLTAQARRHEAEQGVVRAKVALAEASLALRDGATGEGLGGDRPVPEVP